MTEITLQRRPEWLQLKTPAGEQYQHIRQLMRTQTLHTVCEEARCPNIAECWNHGTATFMILGSVCTRSCGFCAIATGKPRGLDLTEPKRVAEAVQAMQLEYAVITSVNRDELQDGGAEIFAATIRWIRRLNHNCKVEVLTPDFKGDKTALNTIATAKPDVFNHNIETVPRLYAVARPQAQYERSLRILLSMKELRADIPTKSGFMLGLGESQKEILQIMHDLREHRVDILTIGQYLRPSFQHLPIQRYASLEEFAELKRMAVQLGFHHVESGPFVRSSYHAHEQVKLLNL